VPWEHLRGQFRARFAKRVENLHRLIDHLLIWLGGSARSRRGLPSTQRPFKLGHLRLHKRMYTLSRRGRSGRGTPGHAAPHGHWKIITFLAGLRSPSAASRTGTDRRCVTADFVHCPIGSGRYDRFQCRHLNIVQLQISSVCMVQPDGPDHLRRHIAPAQITTSQFFVLALCVSSAQSTLRLSPEEHATDHEAPTSAMKASSRLSGIRSQSPSGFRRNLRPLWSGIRGRMALARARPTPLLRRNRRKAIYRPLGERHLARRS
jgi:hypothetical protein